MIGVNVNLINARWLHNMCGLRLKNNSHCQWECHFANQSRSEDVASLSGAVVKSAG